MGQYLVFSQNRTELTRIATGPRKPNPVVETLDRLLVAASSQSYPITFLLCAFDQFEELREDNTQARLRGWIRSLLDILLQQTPEEVYVTCPAMNEYLLVIPRIDSEATISFATQIQAVASSAGLPSLSIACSSFPQHAHSRTALMSQLRETLYTLQQHEPGQVGWWSPPSDTPVSASITPAMWSRFQALAERLGVEENALLQEALEEALNRYAAH